MTHMRRKGRIGDLLRQESLAGGVGKFQRDPEERGSGKGTALLPLPPLRTGLDGFPHPAQAVCKLCQSRTGRTQRTDIRDSGKLT